MLLSLRGSIWIKLCAILPTTFLPTPACRTGVTFMTAVQIVIRFTIRASILCVVFLFFLLYPHNVSVLPSHLLYEWTRWCKNTVTRTKRRPQSTSEWRGDRSISWWKVWGHTPDSQWMHSALSVNTLYVCVCGGGGEEHVNHVPCYNKSSFNDGGVRITVYILNKDLYNFVNQLPSPNSSGFLPGCIMAVLRLWHSTRVCDASFMTYWFQWFLSHASNRGTLIVHGLFRVHGLSPCRHCQRIHYPSWPNALCFPNFRPWFASLSERFVSSYGHCHH